MLEKIGICQNKSNVVALRCITILNLYPNCQMMRQIIPIVQLNIFKCSCFWVFFMKIVFDINTIIHICVICEDRDRV